eukprot:TRINITY_DN2596_c0_g4_i2.p1 TRINITY_DN2596_c0_g4~~TRINITY_DN2596_c0_g4_i2.p1  ORF type:complete len:386 (-),score=137.03 TRINITY_DN2596_c0_g4_i2:28-1185(-)
MKLIGSDDWNPSAAQIPHSKATKAMPEPYDVPTLEMMDAEAVGLVSVRLERQENLYNVQQKEIGQKNGKLTHVKEELEILRITKKDSNGLKKLYEERVELERANKEMKEFLAKQGLKWVGRNIKMPVKFESRPFIDLEVVAKRIEELNIIAERDAKPFVNKDGVHVLAKVDPLPIGFYANGVMIKGYDFHDYNSKEGRVLMKDLLEGYFPYEIKDKYSEGVPLKIVDHTEELYDPKVFKANARGVGKVDEDFRPCSTNEFLKQLPEKVIKDGRIVPVREEAAKKIKAAKSCSTLIEIETDVVLQERKGTKFPQEEVTTIKVRTEKGKRTLMAKVLAKDCVETVYKYVEKYSESGGGFVLRRNYPQEELKRADKSCLLYTSDAADE